MPEPKFISKFTDILDTENKCQGFSAFKSLQSVLDFDYWINEKFSEYRPQECNKATSHKNWKAGNSTMCDWAYILNMSFID